MKEIPLTRGYVALVDDADYEKLARFKWTARLRGRGRKWYATRVVKVSTGSGWSEIQMHRIILGITDPKVLVDHEDHDGLNNQRYNLRKANHKQNAHNARKTLDKTGSKYKGVTVNHGHWQVRIAVAGKRLHVGMFYSEVDAALAYDAAALIHHGEFANLNFPLEAR